MTLEATMIVLDNSDWSRNGDFFPNRWTAQHDAANLLAETKCSLNVESAVGLMTMAGKQVEVLVTPMSDPGKILASLHGVRLGGRVHLSNALQVAQLALKHRMNKNQRQRIVVFVASPVEEDEKALVLLGKKFKKNSVAVDIVSMEVDQDQNKKLRALVEAANNSDNSNFIQGEPGMQMLSDVLLSSPIYQGAEGGNMGGGAGDFGGGAQMDPELEMAIRISLEEEKERNARRDAEKKKDGEGSGAQTADPNKMQVEGQAPAQSDKMTIESQAQPQVDDEDDEEELMRRAKELSLQESAATGGEKKDEQAGFSDPSFVNDLLKDLDLDKEDPLIKEALQKKDGGNKDKDKENK